MNSEKTGKRSDGEKKPERDEFITEQQRHTSVTGAWDVAVVGGGVAGAAAAVAAARNGANTCLVEKENALGGLATLGLIAIYLPLCDGRGNKVISGLGEEFLHLSLKYGPGEIPPCWKDGGVRENRRRRRYSAAFNPASFMLALEEFVLDCGVEIIYDSRYCGIKKDHESCIEALIVENKSGRMALRCGVVVDATGDADVAFDAGEKTVSLDSNRKSGWFFSCNGRKNIFNQLHDPLYSTPTEDPATYAGDDWRDVTRMNIDSRKLILGKLKSDGKLNDKNYPLILPVIPQFRMTRRLSGPFELDENKELQKFPDTAGLTGDWRRSGPIHALPYRCLRGTKTPNLLAAGRCISVTNRMWDITRAIPACVVTGQAAGTAAAIAVKERCGVAELKVSILQAGLKKQSVILEI